MEEKPISLSLPFYFIYLLLGFLFSKFIFVFSLREFGRANTSAGRIRTEPRGNTTRRWYDK